MPIDFFCRNNRSIVTANRKWQERNNVYNKEVNFVVYLREMHFPPMYTCKFQKISSGGPLQPLFMENLG